MKTLHYKFYTNIPFFNHQFFFLSMALQHSIQTQSQTSVVHYIFKYSWVYIYRNIYSCQEAQLQSKFAYKRLCFRWHTEHFQTLQDTHNRNNLCSSHGIVFLPLLCIHFRFCIREACGFGDLCTKSTNRIVLFPKSVVQEKRTRTVCAKYVLSTVFC